MELEERWPTRVDVYCHYPVFTLRANAKANWKPEKKKEKKRTKQKKSTSRLEKAEKKNLFRDERRVKNEEKGGKKWKQDRERAERALRGACVIVSVCLCIYEMYVRVNVSWKNCGYPSIVNANLVLLPQLVRENSQSWLPHFWPHFADLLVKSRVHFPLFFRKVIYRKWEMLESVFKCFKEVWWIQL